jgi:hypothetical protein
MADKKPKVSNKKKKNRVGLYDSTAVANASEIRASGRG